MIVHELRCDDCGWRQLVSDLIVTECHIDPLAFHEHEHRLETLRDGRSHAHHFTRTTLRLDDD